MTTTSVKYSDHDGERKEDRRDHRGCAPQDIRGGIEVNRFSDDPFHADIEAAVGRKGFAHVFGFAPSLLPLPERFPQIDSAGGPDKKLKHDFLPIAGGKSAPVRHCMSKGRFNSLPVIEVSK